MKTGKGSELIFISRIKRDGSGVEIIDKQEIMSYFADNQFDLNCLSITQGTWIACEYNSYVVKLKRPNQS